MGGRWVYFTSETYFPLNCFFSWQRQEIGTFWTCDVCRKQVWVILNRNSHVFPFPQWTRTTKGPAWWLHFSNTGKCGHLYIHRPSINIQLFIFLLSMKSSWFDESIFLFFQLFPTMNFHGHQWLHSDTFIYNLFTITIYNLFTIECKFSFKWNWGPRIQ